MKWIIESRKLALKSFISVYDLTMRHELFGGGMTGPLSRTIVEKGRACAVVMYDPTEKLVILVKQFRASMTVFSEDQENPWMEEIPAGFIEEGEEPEISAIRECKEETGFEVFNLEKIGDIYASPGVYGEKTRIFYAEFDSSKNSKKFGGLEFDNEDLLIIRINIEQIREGLTKGRFMDAKTIIGLQWLMAKLSISN